MSEIELGKSQSRSAQDRLDSYLQELIDWHFSPDTGAPYWLNWADGNDIDPRSEVKRLEDLIRIFPVCDDRFLYDVDHEFLIPKHYQGKPFKVFETGGTTGRPKHRLSWEDHLIDYSEFSTTLDPEYFPMNSNWLMIGPTGPRRLRLCIEHLANIRGGSCYFIDMDPRWVKNLIADGKLEIAKQYKEHVIDQALVLLKSRRISCLFTTPLLLEALGERISIPDRGIKGVFCGGTTMTPQTVRFLVEEVLENRTQLVPTYGNTLMGLACSLPIQAQDNYSITYWAPEPRAIIRIVDPNNTGSLVEYGQSGRIELTTLTPEFFLPRYLERDEGIRRPPCDQYPWDGVGDVRPFKSLEANVIEGVY